MVALGLAAASAPAWAQATDPPRVLGSNIRDQATAVLSLMSYTIVPDVTTSSLSMSNTSTGNPSLLMTQLGGGFTVSRDAPVYLEGNAAYTRFDPRFLVSSGTEQREVPTRWNSVTLTVGVGWDFPLARDLVLRPILMYSAGRVASDLSVGAWYIERNSKSELSFLDGGSMEARGGGASLMLDFERARPERDTDLEIRYSQLRLSTHSDNEEMNTTVTAKSLNIWGRLRTPTGYVVLDRPLRSVLELTHSNFLGGQAGDTGFNALTSLGVGMEVDLTAYEQFVTRARAVVRYLRGSSVEGWSLGLAVSF
ncbi:MAG TPA: hypothetical protein VFL64_09930 [Rhizobacter sp.]|nr:hypothetical protein [Rhizobacter sp.]